MPPEIPSNCLIQQTHCGRVAGTAICPKCGADEQLRYTTQEAVMLAKAQAAAMYWQNEAAEITQRSADTQAQRQDEEKNKRVLTPTAFQDHPTTPQMVELPSGSFLMGSADNELGSSANERPQHKVTIAYKLAMGRYPVTFEEWDACVLDGGTQYKPKDMGWGRGKRPVINVSWDDAQAYIAWLNKKLGIEAKDPHRYRLPSEAEWEYACRAGSRATWCFGDDEDQLQKYAWYSANSGGQTHPVGQKNANAFGLYDMHGNVSEWVQDRYGVYCESALSNGSAWLRQKVEDGSLFEKILGLKKSSGFRVLRGGSWSGYGRLTRAAIRNINSPGSRFYDIGFRLARKLP